MSQSYEIRCGQNRCDALATKRMFWPGSPPRPICDACVAHALRIAAVMGFYLHVEAL